MARLLVEIDETLKRELKSRLARNGETLKAWLTRAASLYVGATVSPPAPARRAAPPPPAPRPEPAPRVEPRTSREPEAPTEPPAQPPRPPRRYDDYLD